MICYNSRITRKEVSTVGFQTNHIKRRRRSAPYLRAQYRSCDYSVLGVFMWADRFGYEYKTEDGVLFMRERSRHGGEYDYLLPTGEGSLCDRVHALREAVGAGLTMSLVPEDALGRAAAGI